MSAAIVRRMFEVVECFGEAAATIPRAVDDHDIETFPAREFGQADHELRHELRVAPPGEGEGLFATFTVGVDMRQQIAERVSVGRENLGRVATA